KLAREVIEVDEKKANEYEILIEEEAIKIIALHQPEATPLRTLIMVIKINNDLERIGDHAVNISEAALALIPKPYVKRLIDIPRMAEMAIGMLKDSLTAFLTNDSELARNVCQRDDEVDGMRDQIFRELLTFMMSDPNTIERSFSLILITRNLERIADLATNIAEDVIYITKGDIIKHGRGREKEGDS
ncbi:MAG: phosphate signaling complex protein PhoU, partial [candidate division WOR-3 bacterium]